MCEQWFREYKSGQVSLKSLEALDLKWTQDMYAKLRVDLSGDDGGEPPCQLSGARGSGTLHRGGTRAVIVLSLHLQLYQKGVGAHASGL